MKKAVCSFQIFIRLKVILGALLFISNILLLTYFKNHGYLDSVHEELVISNEDHSIMYIFSPEKSPSISTIIFNFIHINIDILFQYKYM